MSRARELEALLAHDEFPWAGPAGGNLTVFVRDFHAFAERVLGRRVTENELDAFVEQAGGRRRRIFQLRALIGRLFRSGHAPSSRQIYALPPTVVWQARRAGRPD